MQSHKHNEGYWLEQEEVVWKVVGSNLGAGRLESLIQLWHQKMSLFDN